MLHSGAIRLLFYILTYFYHFVNNIFRQICPFELFNRTISPHLRHLISFRLSGNRFP